MSDIIGVRVNDSERGVLLAIQKELGDISFSQVFRIGLFSLSTNENLKNETREMLSKLADIYKHDIQRTVTKYELSKLMMVNNQLKLIDSLKRQGIPEKNLSRFKEILQDELKSVGIEYTHSEMPCMRFRKKR